MAGPSGPRSGKFKHGMSYGFSSQRRTSPEYAVWQAMRQRCSNPNHKAYSIYGGRGIKTCPEWDSFARFLADMGPKPRGYTIERLDNDGDYEPGNCKWASSAISAPVNRFTGSFASNERMNEGTSSIF